MSDYLCNHPYVVIDIVQYYQRILSLDADIFGSSFDVAKTLNADDVPSTKSSFFVLVERLPSNASSSEK